MIYLFTLSLNPLNLDAMFREEPYRTYYIVCVETYSWWYKVNLC